MLPVQIQNELRARKLQYYVELNKMEGDYAPAKIAQTDTEGNDIVWNETRTYEVNKKANPGS